MLHLNIKQFACRQPFDFNRSLLQMNIQALAVHITLLFISMQHTPWLKNGANKEVPKTAVP